MDSHHHASLDGVKHYDHVGSEVHLRVVSKINPLLGCKSGEGFALQTTCGQRLTYHHNDRSHSHIPLLTLYEDLGRKYFGIFGVVSRD